MPAHTAISVVLVSLLLLPPAMLAMRWGRGRPWMPGRDALRVVERGLAFVGAAAGGRLEPLPTTVGATEEPSPQGSGELRALPRQQLYDLARLHGVAGRSRMSRDELIDALTRLDATAVQARPLGDGRRPAVSRP
jgi:hypothetical protein